MVASATWGPTLQEGVKAEEVDMIPYELTLGYDKWTYREHTKTQKTSGFRTNKEQTT